MDEAPSWPEAIYVLKGGRRLGPFSVDDLLDGLESGDFSEEDVCLREGSMDCERLRDLLDWDDAATEAGDLEGDEGDDEEGEDEDPDHSGEEPAPPSRGERGGQGAVLPPDRLLYSGHPSVLTYPFSLAAAVGGGFGAVWLHSLGPLPVLGGLVLAAAGLARLGLVRFTHDFHIRPRRVEIVTGLFARSSREVRIGDIRSINVTCRGLSGIFGIGTVDFLTSGDAPEITFHRVWAARKIKALVRRLQDAG